MAAATQSLTQRSQSRAPFFPNLKELSLKIDTNNTLITSFVALLLPPTLERLTIRGRDKRNASKNAALTDNLFRRVWLPNLKYLRLEGELFCAPRDVKKCLSVIKHSAASSLQSLVVPVQFELDAILPFSHLETFEIQASHFETIHLPPLPFDGLPLLRQVDADSATVRNLLCLASSCALTSLTVRVNGETTSSVREVQQLLDKISKNCAGSLESLCLIKPHEWEPAGSGKDLDISCFRTCTRLRRLRVAGSPADEWPSPDLFEKALKCWTNLVSLDVRGYAYLGRDELINLLRACPSSLRSLKVAADVSSEESRRSTEPFPIVSLDFMAFRFPSLDYQWVDEVHGQLVTECLHEVRWAMVPRRHGQGPGWRHIIDSAP